MKFFAALLASSIALIAPAGFAQAGAASDPAAGRMVLLVDEYKAIRNFPLLVAERLGYLSDGGALVTVMNIRDDIPTAQMLLDGRVDAVMAYYHHNIVNRSEGRNLEAIATLGVTPGVKVMVANQARDKYKTAADLKGSRIIAGGAGSSKTTVANSLMMAGGHRIGDYTRIVNESKDKIVAALKSGSADLVVAPTPDGSFYEAAGVATLFADLTSVEGTRKALGSLLPTSTIYMASERVKARPDIAQHLANAFVRALKYINAHTAEEVMAIIPNEIVGKDRAAYLAALKEEMPMFATDGRMPAEDAAKEWQVLSEFNPKFKSVKVGETYTNVFVEEALRKYR
jgi:NitT/TauT family transport system substrate-binding protein